MSVEANARRSRGFSREGVTTTRREEKTDRRRDEARGRDCSVFVHGRACIYAATLSRRRLFMNHMRTDDDSTSSSRASRSRSDADGARVRAKTSSSVRLCAASKRILGRFDGLAVDGGDRGDRGDRGDVGFFARVGVPFVPFVFIFALERFFTAASISALDAFDDFHPPSSFSPSYASSSPNMLLLSLT